MQRKDIVGKYLALYAEQDTRILEQIDGEFGHVLVIPAYGEDAQFEETLASIPCGPLGQVLVIVVVNAPENAPSLMLDRNQKLLQHLFANPVTTRGHRIFCIDRSRVPPKQGVGLARKIGCDIALKLWHAGKLASPWIHCTDADVMLPTDYFSQVSGCDDNVAAWVYAFRHVGDAQDHIQQATMLHEIALRLYVAGLAFAGSPHAYHAIGSTMAFRAHAYAAVRGFPKRAAGEDFYLLNKLAKVGAIQSGQDQPILIRSRPSLRVPFGTGPAAVQIADAMTRGDVPNIYHPNVFRTLKSWLLDPSEIGVDLTQYPTIEMKQRAFHTWFDAFRTMKMINELRDTRFPNLSVEALIRDHRDYLENDLGFRTNLRLLPLTPVTFSLPSGGGNTREFIPNKTDRFDR